MENKKKMSGLAKGMLVTAIIAVVALITTICFAVSLSTDAIKGVFNNPTGIRESLINVGRFADELSEFKDYNELIFSEEKNFPVKSKTLTINAEVAEITVVLSDSDEIKTTFSQYSNISGKSSGYTLETDGSDFRIVRNSDSVNGIWPTLTVAIPKDKIKTVDINNKTGDIEVDGITVDMLEINDKVGSIEVANTTAKEAVINNKTGNIELDEAFKCLGTLKVNTSVGNIDFALPKDVNFKLSYFTSVGGVNMKNVDMSLYTNSEVVKVTKAEGSIESEFNIGQQISYDINVNVGDINFS